MTPWVRRLLVANVLVFFLQQTVAGLTNALAFIPRFAFVQPWTFVTYMFVHGSISHILFNMLSLYFFGPRVEERMGSNRFITLYMIAGLSGAVLSMIFGGGAAIIGASGAIFGVTLAFARFWPTAQIYIFGILPLEARVMVILYALVSVFFGFSGGGGGIAHFAHLGGFAGAWAYLTWLDRTAGTRSFRAQTIAKVPKDVLGNWKKVDPKSVHEVNRDEVNRILDKISSKGLGSLTPQERVFLANFVPLDDRVPPVS